MSKNNGWIKCSDRLPEIFVGFDLLNQSKVVLVYGKLEKEDKPCIFGGKLLGDKWHSVDGECYQITHWQPLPEPPQD